MPFTSNSCREPSANVNGTGDPSSRWWLLAYPLSTKAPSSPRLARIAPEPSCHSRLNIWLAAGFTAVVLILFPNASASPARTFPTASTPGVFATASAAAIGIGEKLFCAVIA